MANAADSAARDSKYSKDLHRSRSDERRLDAALAPRLIDAMMTAEISSFF
jgi:hypothetical protein